VAFKFILRRYTKEFTSQQIQDQLFLGMEVQVDPIKPKLEPHGTKRLKPNCDILLSNFALTSTCSATSGRAGGRRAAGATGPAAGAGGGGRGGGGGAGGPAASIALPGAPQRVRVSAERGAGGAGAGLVRGRGLHSSTFQVNLSRFGHTSACPAV